MPARKGRKPAATEVADAQAKDETAPPSKKRAVSEEKEELDEVEKESEAVSEDEASKPKRGRGRPKKAVNDAPKVAKGPRGRPAKQKQENKEDKDENDDKTTKPRKGRGRKTTKEEDVREKNSKSKANGKDQAQLTVEHCKS
ncbi:hypothetical protein R5R35_007553 [Gryllus longicercus]|uniref:Uncharacterized protein n=1 Tax=Gryllus longicercus TaxID=2509291 RepID=A0AAN9VVX5_9ORTH